MMDMGAPSRQFACSSPAQSVYHLGRGKAVLLWNVHGWHVRCFVGWFHLFGSFDDPILTCGPKKTNLLGLVEEPEEARGTYRDERV